MGALDHNIQFADLFPIPLLIDSFGESARPLNAQLVADIQVEMEASPASSERSFISGWQSRSGLEADYDSFATLRTEIGRVAAAFLRQLGVADAPSYRCSGLWANYMAVPGAFSAYHIHGSGHTVATGVYYPAPLLRSGVAPPVNLDEFEPSRVFGESGLGGELVIYDPGYAVKRQIIKPPGSRYYETQKSVIPSESLLVMFPHYLPHGVDPIREAGVERYSISYTIERTGES